MTARRVSAGFLLCSLLAVGLTTATVASAPSAVADASPVRSAAAELPSSASGGLTPDVRANYTVDPLPDQPSTVRVRATFEILSASEFQPFLVDDPRRGSHVTVESTSGFQTERVNNGRSIQFNWDGSTSPATVTYTLDGGWGVEGGDWLLVQRSAVDAIPQPSSLAVGSSVEVETDQPTVRGDEYTFVGQHRTHTRDGSLQQFTMVVPANASMVAEPDEVLALLDSASTAFGGPPPTDRVYVFVASGIEEDGSAGGDAIVYEGRPLTGTEAEDAAEREAQSIWLHEYVHTQQTYLETESRFVDGAGEQMKWFNEGSADYFTALTLLREGETSFETFRTFVERGEGGENKPYMDDTLADRSTWDNTNTQYVKGRRVLAALDPKIHNATSGERSLYDVLDRMNAENGTVTFDDFKRIVAAVAGESFDAWLDRYVTTGEAPPVPANETVYVGPTEPSTPTKTSMPEATGTSSSGTTGASSSGVTGTFGSQPTVEQTPMPGTTTAQRGPGFGATVAVAALLLAGLLFTRRS